MGKASGQNDENESVWDKDTAKGGCKAKASSFVSLVACRPTKQNSPGARPSALDRLEVLYL